jgi:hypothetical protein
MCAPEGLPGRHQDVLHVRLSNTQVWQLMIPEAGVHLTSVLGAEHLVTHGDPWLTDVLGAEHSATCGHPWLNIPPPRVAYRMAPRMCAGQTASCRWGSSGRPQFWLTAWGYSGNLQ